ncbi:hypothetical protein [Streptomyces tsukubensis]|uniref:N-acetyltransferase n=1 Tax=Streptomyces tsukubensis TaxID=83656 RepID=A0A1V4A7W0_9ACTN|nr:hypothetical protein [Streptomyces tsukubensis]OON78046.1 hypothetical protein B1H18_17655 [Streptomyces tsukubensis]QFR97209.1 hypothetical protein GBW32_34310 [Streptomyces tsukubensis]
MTAHPRGHFAAASPRGHRIAPASSAHRGQGRTHRLGQLRGRWHRRLFARRRVEILDTFADLPPNTHCLLLVHIRKIVGHVSYQVCEECGAGLITEMAVDASLTDSGLGDRAMAFLRGHYQGLRWRTTLDDRPPRSLVHRLPGPRPLDEELCAHVTRAADQEPRSAALRP